MHRTRRINYYFVRRVVIYQPFTKLDLIWWSLVLTFAHLKASARFRNGLVRIICSMVVPEKEYCPTHGDGSSDEQDGGFY